MRPLICIGEPVGLITVPSLTGFYWVSLRLIRWFAYRRPVATDAIASIGSISFAYAWLRSGLPSFTEFPSADGSLICIHWITMGFTGFYRVSTPDETVICIPAPPPSNRVHLICILVVAKWFTEFYRVSNPRWDSHLHICVVWLAIGSFLFVFFFLPSPCWEIDIGFLLIWLGVDRIDMNKTFNLIELARWIRRLNRIVVETAQTKPITEADSIQRWNHGIQLCCIDRKTLKSIALSITKPKDKTREN